MTTAADVTDLVKRALLLPLQVAHSDELEALHKLLHFPEEVALRLAATEYRLFYQVPPIDYLRQVTLDLGGAAQPTDATQPCDAQPQASGVRSSVRTLIKRFNEVSRTRTISDEAVPLVISLFISPANEHQLTYNVR